MKPVDIVLVDDDGNLTTLLSSLLTSRGYHVMTAKHGEDALHLLARLPTPPALILLDLDMPVMSGSTFRQAQLQNPAFASIPVVILSGMADVYPQARTLQVAEFVVKPINPLHILDVAERYCQVRDPRV